MLLLSLLACKNDEDVAQTKAREPGERAPLTRACSDLDSIDCFVPWPNSAFLRADDSTETGVRVTLDPTQLPVDDSVAWMNSFDGFSRVTGVGFGLDEEPTTSWDPGDSLSADDTFQVLVAEPGSDYGRRVAFRTEAVDVSSIDEPRFLFIGRPVEVLPPSSEVVAVLLDQGTASKPVKVALGITEPSTDAEAELFAYHAPTRQLLEDSDIDPERVTRLTDFVTRSQRNATWRMHAMIDELDEALADGELDVVFDSIAFPSATALAAIVQGRLTGAPDFLDEGGYLRVDDDGTPIVQGKRDIAFRMSIPATTEPYKVVLYGHGTGGDVNDSSFDVELAEVGIAKLNLRWDGWTGDDFVETLLDFSTFLDGSERSTSGLMQSLAGGTVLLTALDGVLGDAVAAAELAGEPNPAAGIRPDTTDVPWVGGSMGGTMGAVMVSADPRITTGILNVPGAGWTHMIPHSLLYESGMESLLQQTYSDPADIHIAMLMAQSNWDDVDGGVWAEEALAVGGAFLLQESMGDPVLPNLCTELLANSLGAVQIEPVLEPIEGLERVDGTVKGGAALTQFRVPDTGQYDVHGFAARDTPAGAAAMEQFTQLLLTAWDGKPKMTHPTLCSDVTDDGSCDFSGMWSD